MPQREHHSSSPDYRAAMAFGGSAAALALMGAVELMTGAAGVGAFSLIGGGALAVGALGSIAYERFRGH